jgi:hypothetical protein
MAHTFIVIGFESNGRTIYDAFEITTQRREVALKRCVRMAYAYTKHGAASAHVYEQPGPCHELRLENAKSVFSITR